MNVLYGTVFLQAVQQPIVMKKSLPKPSAKALLSRVKKEMKRGRNTKEDSVVRRVKPEFPAGGSVLHE